jgi:hypothetical protein
MMPTDLDLTKISNLFSIQLRGLPFEQKISLGVNKNGNRLYRRKN